MIIVQDTRLRQKYKGLPRGIQDVTEIVIHATGGGRSAKDIIDWMSSDICERISLYKQAIGLFAYIIDFDGIIYNIMPVNDWYFHSDAGQHDKHTIGIEMMNNGAGNTGKFTDSQYKALNELIGSLIEYYPINSIASHDANRREYSNLDPKPCPGINFDYKIIEQFVTDNVGNTIIIKRG
jgi:hypothetical protein